MAPWHGEDTTAQLIPRHGGLLSVEEVMQTCADLHRDGVRRVLTPALGRHDRVPFVEAGFEVHEDLHLLRFDLSAAMVTGSLPQGDRARTRRARRLDVSRVLEVDHAAFDPFWQLGTRGIDEAVAATPQSRYRVTGRPVTGYIICGYALRSGYIQRLAVHPDAQGAGVGRGLLLDALRWLSRRQVRVVLVNTQLRNNRAVSLYESLGFELQDDGLSVLVHEAG